MLTRIHIVIKIGGVASKQLTLEILTQTVRMAAGWPKIIIVHGGGFAINQLMEEHEVHPNPQDQWSACDEVQSDMGPLYRSLS